MRKMTIGDRLPNFLLDDFDGKAHELYATDLTGGPIIVITAGTGADITRITQQFADQKAFFEEHGAHCYLVLESPSDPGPQRYSGFFPLKDEGGKASAIYRNAAGLDYPALYTTDPNQRIIATAGPDDLARFADIARAAIERTALREAPRSIGRQAPVLFIPSVIEESLCDRLIDAWSTGKQEKNIVNVAKGYSSSQAAQAETKRRIDHIVEGQLEHDTLLALMPRVAPEVERAFAFDKEWGFEKFRVGCYEATDAGFFRAHRDNPSAGLRHRHFAASINLNDGYEGGSLRFPEYGMDLYAPPKCGALIFACGLLHEVVPVSAGRRFTLLTFLNTQ